MTEVEEKKSFLGPKRKAYPDNLPGQPISPGNIEVDIKKVRKMLKNLTVSDVHLLKINMVMMAVALYAVQGRKPDAVYVELIDRMDTYAATMPKDITKDMKMIDILETLSNADE